MFHTDLYVWINEDKSMILNRKEKIISRGLGMWHYSYTKCIVLYTFSHFIFHVFTLKYQNHFNKNK